MWHFLCNLKVGSENYGDDGSSLKKGVTQLDDSGLGIENISVCIN